MGTVQVEIRLVEPDGTIVYSTIATKTPEAGAEASATTYYDTLGALLRTYGFEVESRVD